MTCSIPSDRTRGKETTWLSNEEMPRVVSSRALFVVCICSKLSWMVRIYNLNNVYNIMSSFLIALERMSGEHLRSGVTI